MEIEPSSEDLTVDRSRLRRGSAYVHRAGRSFVGFTPVGLRPKAGGVAAVNHRLLASNPPGSRGRWRHAMALLIPKGS